MQESDIISEYQVISEVLDLLWHDESYIPRFDSFDDLNPEHDRIRGKILRAEARWNWRDKVFRSISCIEGTELHCPVYRLLIYYDARILPFFCARIRPKLNPGRIIPLSPMLCHGFWRYHLTRQFSKQSGYAIRIVATNFKRLGVIEQ